jgi:hypothetical protein
MLISPIGTEAQVCTVTAEQSKAMIAEQDEPRSPLMQPDMAGLTALHAVALACL